MERSWMRSSQSHMISLKAIRMLFPLVHTLFLNGNFLELVHQGNFFSWKGNLLSTFSKQARLSYLFFWNMFLDLLILSIFPASEACFDFFYLQLMIIACINMTVFVRTHMDIDVLHANYYMGTLFYALVMLCVDGISEMSLTI